MLCVRMMSVLHGFTASSQSGRLRVLRQLRVVKHICVGMPRRCLDLMAILKDHATPMCLEGILCEGVKPGSQASALMGEQCLGVQGHCFPWGKTLPTGIETIFSPGQDNAYRYRDNFVPGARQILRQIDNLIVGNLRQI